MKMDYEIILASGSPRRKELLNLLNVDYRVLSSDVDESVAPNTPPENAVSEIAERKARAILNLEALPETTTYVIGADTTVVLDEEMLGKPVSKENATEMLARLSGRAHEVLTGVALLKAETGNVSISRGVQSTVVFFRNLDEREIEAYVDTEEPMDKAGSYALQGLGSAFVEKIEGCYTNVIGLPIPLTISLLRKAGVKILNC